MAQLIERNTIKNKKVLSMECRSGFEEYRFLKNDNSMVMTDADGTYGTIKPRAEKCSVKHNTVIAFNIEDCRKATKSIQTNLNLTLFIFQASILMRHIGVVFNRTTSSKTF